MKAEYVRRRIIGKMQIVFVLEKKTESALIGRQQVKHLHVLDVYVAENSQLNNHALSG